jgi:hypothetical protein
LKPPPAVTFTTDRSISEADHICRFRVFFGGSEAHCDTTTVFLVSASTAESGASTYVYASKFLPRFWEELANTASE